MYTRVNDIVGTVAIIPYDAAGQNVMRQPAYEQVRPEHLMQFFPSRLGVILSGGQSVSLVTCGTNVMTTAKRSGDPSGESCCVCILLCGPFLHPVTTKERNRRFRTRTFVQEDPSSCSDCLTLSIETTFSHHFLPLAVAALLFFSGFRVADMKLSFYSQPLLLNVRTRSVCFGFATLCQSKTASCDFPCVFDATIQSCISF